MITGDNAASATSVAREVGIDSDMVFADALPEEKSRILARFLQKGPAIYVGDNYNDILCFASASFSFCVAGSDMKSVDDDCADATLMSSETPPLSRIPLTICLARRMNDIVTQNHCWAVIYNILSLAWALGMGGIGPPSS
jgi:Cu+-exporting ATPase